MLDEISVVQILTLKDLSSEEAGWYTCLAGNSIGTQYETAWLTVMEGTPFWARNFISLLLFTFL